MQKTLLESCLFISERIYSSNEWHSLAEIVNTSDKGKVVCIEQPLKTILYNNQYFLEVNNFNIDAGVPNFYKYFYESIRTDHLNNEESSAIILKIFF